MESRVDAFLTEQDRQVAEDEETRPYEKRVYPCGSCGYHRIHEWNPISETWNCTVCGTPWKDQSDWFDALDWREPQQRRRG